jgi:hypothetical protein
LKFGLVVAIFPNLVTNDYKSHIVVNGLVTFWLIFTNVFTLKKMKTLDRHFVKQRAKQGQNTYITFGNGGDRAF